MPPRGFPLQWATATAHLSSFGRRAQLGVFVYLKNPSNSTPTRRCAAKTLVRFAGHCHHFGQHTHGTYHSSHYVNLLL